MLITIISKNPAGYNQGYILFRLGLEMGREEAAQYRLSDRLAENRWACQSRPNGKTYNPHRRRHSKLGTGPIYFFFFNGGSSPSQLIFIAVLASVVTGDCFRCGNHSLVGKGQ